MTIYCFNEYHGNAVFSCNEMGILNIGLNHINLDDTNYNEDDPETITHVTLLVWLIKFEKRKVLKKELTEEIMLVVWHPRRWCYFYKSGDEKKETTNF